MQNILWILYILVFIIAASAGLKVSFDANGENVKHLILAGYFYPSLVGCFILAYGFKFFQTKSDSQEESLQSITSSPDTYLSSIVASFPSNHHVQQENIEEIQAICLQMADERFAYIQKYGIQNFSELFEFFSHGERYLNRSWSALIDNHYEESQASFETSQKYFEHALEKFKQLS
ncbi:hypothetical protein MJH12_02785 [bacterium]|nr:hypothetical protein [bacterium]